MTVRTSIECPEGIDIDSVITEFDSVAPALEYEVDFASRRFVAGFIDYLCPSELDWEGDKSSEYDPHRAIKLAQMVMTMSVKERAEVLALATLIARREQSPQELRRLP